MTTTDTTQNKRLVDEFVQELFTKGDLDAIDRYLDPGFVDHDPPVPGAPSGLDGLRQAAVIFRQACPDWHSDVDMLIAEGDIVVEVFTASGTHRAELLGAAPTGKTITLRGINVFRIADNRIVERWGCLDQLGTLQQLGQVPVR